MATGLQHLSVSLFGEKVELALGLVAELIGKVSFDVVHLSKALGHRDGLGLGQVGEPGNVEEESLVHPLT